MTTASPTSKWAFAAQLAGYNVTVDCKLQIHPRLIFKQNVTYHVHNIMYAFCSPFTSGVGGDGDPTMQDDF